MYLLIFPDDCRIIEVTKLWRCLHMAYAAKLLQSLVPITWFNRGKASQIFDRLATERQLIVLKNNQPSAIILSPEEYNRLAEIEEDYTLLLEATTRLAENGKKAAIPMDTLLSDLGISEDELDATVDVEIE